MLSFKNVIIIFLSLIILFFTYIIISAIINTDYSKFEYIQDSSNNSETTILDVCKGIDSVTYQNFPYKKYVKNINFSDVASVEKDISQLDSLTGDSFISQDILSTALTSKIVKDTITYNLDSLNMILIRADNFYIYSKLSKDKSSLFEAVANFWYLYVSRNLSYLAKKQVVNKYNFKYRYLAQRCTDKGFLINEGNSLKEKVVLNIINQKWTYLFNRFWNATSVVFKLVFSIGLLIFVVIFLLIIKCVTKKNYEK